MSAPDSHYTSANHCLHIGVRSPDVQYTGVRPPDVQCTVVRSPDVQYTVVRPPGVQVFAPLTFNTLVSTIANRLDSYPLRPIFWCPLLLTDWTPPPDVQFTGVRHCSCILEQTNDKLNAGTNLHPTLNSGTPQTGVVTCSSAYRSQNSGSPDRVHLLCL